MPASATSSIASSVLRVNVAPSPVLCTSMRVPVSVATMFASTSARESSSYGRSSRTRPSTTPTLTAATWHDSGFGSASRPCAPSQVTASASATYAPVIGRGAGAAVGLQDVAVERDRVLAERGEVDARAQRPADQPADLVRTAADAALHRLAVAAGVRGRRQHRVLGGDPAEPGPLAPARHALGHARRAQHLRLAELDEHRARRVLLETPGDGHRAELVVGPAVCACHRSTL